MSLTKYAEFSVLAVESAQGEVLSGSQPERTPNPFVKQAHRHEFEYDRRPGYIYVRSRAISSRCNDNYDEFPADEIRTAYRTFVGKPVFVNHHNANHRRARGVIIDAALHEDLNPDGSEDVWAEVLMEVDAVRFPRLAEAVIAGDVARTSMGTDVEYSDCTACGNRAYTPAEYCQHIPRMKGMKVRRVLASGQTEEVLVAERCHGLRFFENSLLVEPPADPTAFVLGVDGEGVIQRAASKTAKDERVAPSEHGDPRMQDAGVSVSKTKDGKYYVHTHRARGKYRDSVADIPDSEIKQIRSTGRLAEAAVESGLGDVLDFLRGGRDPSSQCLECGSTFKWSEPLHRWICPEGHKTAPVLALRKVEAMCSECNPGEGLPTHLCSPHAMLAKAEHRWGDLGPNSPYGATQISAMLAEADALLTEAFFRDDSGKVYDKPVGGTHPKAEEIPAGSTTFKVKHDPADKTWGLGGDAHERDLDAKYDARAERERRRVQREQAAPRTNPAPVTPRAASLRRTLAAAVDSVPDLMGFMRNHPAAIKARYKAAVEEAEAVKVLIDGGDHSPATLARADQALASLREALIDMGIPFEASLRHEAYGETKAPAQVDTLRADRCPVCKDDEAFNGEKCSVCGHVEPPSQFRDPDLSKAQEVDLRQDKAEEAGVDVAADPGLLADDPNAESSGDLECTNCGEVFSAEGESATDTDSTEPDAEAKADPEHPDDPEDPDDEAPAEDDDLGDLADLDEKDIDEALDEDDDEEDVEESDEQEDPAEDAPDDLSDLTEVAPNMTCPVCGQGTLVPAEAATEQPDVEGTGVDTMTEQTAGQPANPAKQARNRIISALQVQQAEIGILKAALREVVTAAGVQHNPKFASLMATAADTNNNPEGAPATTTEQAKAPDAKDNVENVGAAPAPANAGVTPEAVTDVQNSNVAADKPVLDNLQDVTAPVAGTDSVVDKTHNEGEITSQAPNNDVMDPPGSSGWKTSAKGDDRERFTATLRLARLQIRAGLADGEDLTVAQNLFESEASLAEISTEASTLERVAAKQAEVRPSDQHRHLVPRAASGGRPSLQSQPGIAAVASRGDEDFLFGFDAD